MIGSDHKEFGKPENTHGSSFRAPQAAGKEIKMYGDIFNRDFGKARQEMYLQEAQRCRRQAAPEVDAPESIDEGAAPSMGGILRFLGWIFRPSDVASADGNP
jgi:hypothetical protein